MNVHPRGYRNTTYEHEGRVVTPGPSQMRGRWGNPTNPATAMGGNVRGLVMDWGLVWWEVDQCVACGVEDFDVLDEHGQPVCAGCAGLVPEDTDDGEWPIHDEIMGRVVV